MIYLAGPLFSTAEREFNTRLAEEIKIKTGLPVFLPQDECGNLKKPDDIFNSCIDGIDRSDLVVAILDGPDSDSGTCFEAGYAYAKGVPVIGIRTDFRQCGDDGGLNLMLSISCSSLLITSSMDSGADAVMLAEKIRSLIMEDN